MRAQTDRAPGVRLVTDYGRTAPADRDTSPVLADYIRTKLLDGFADEIEAGTADMSGARRLHAGCANEATYFTFRVEDRWYTIQVERASHLG